MPSVLPPGSELRCPGLLPHPLRHLRGAAAERPQFRGISDLWRRDPALLQPPLVARLVLPQPGGLHGGADEGPPRLPQEEAPGATGEESLQALLQEEPEESGGGARWSPQCGHRPDYVYLHQPQLQRPPGRRRDTGRKSAGARGCQQWSGAGGQAGVTACAWSGASEDTDGWCWNRLNQQVRRCGTFQETWLAKPFLL
ncbi:uncharacterized protein [Ranitomeya imitator]|uniref:uncharacterized protein isoform X1 n=1 Tax=Ranitomeya imitator TaxID=111125 RepID=UPI0037E7F757